MAFDDWDLRYSVNKRYLWRTSWTKLRVGGLQEWINKSKNRLEVLDVLYIEPTIFGTFTDFHAYFCIPVYLKSIDIFDVGKRPWTCIGISFATYSRCWAPAWQHPEGKASDLAPSNGKMFQFADLNINGFDVPFRSPFGYHFPEASVAKCKERGSFSLLGACYCNARFIILGTWTKFFIPPTNHL